MWIMKIGLIIFLMRIKLRVKMELINILYYIVFDNLSLFVYLYIFLYCNVYLICN